MSKHEWKPGDVAMLRLKHRADGRVHNGGPAIGIRDNVGSWACGAAIGRTAHDKDVTEAHPLVVIDPEDREQVERLTRELRARGIGPCDEKVDGDGVANALREFANPTPPKPDEPQGLGAVVEDADGARWVRAGRTISHPADDWRCIEGEHVGWWAEYSKITVVRVLSEGVS